MILFCPKVHSCQDLVVNFKPPHVIHLLAEATEGTGWSKVTVTNNISLTNLKNAKNCLTQWFLESFYAAVLVFWCLKMIRWKKMVHFSVAPKWSDNFTLVQLLKFWHTRKSSWMFKYVWLYLLCLMILRMSWGCLRKSFVVWAVFWGWQSCLGLFCGYLRVQSIQGWVLLKPTHQFGSTLKCKENSHQIILGHQNTKTAA